MPPSRETKPRQKGQVMSEEREILRQEIKDYFADRKASAKDIPLEKMEKYMELISQDISAAVGSIDFYNAPFLIMILEQYAEGIRRKHPDIEEIVSVLKLMCRQEEITVVLPQVPGESVQEEDDE